MKVIKPMQLSLLHKVYESAPDTVLTVSVLVFFPFEAPRRVLPEIALWKFVPAALGPDTVFDLCMPKPRGEVLVTGSAFPSGGVAQAACKVRVALGGVDKSLRVVGDREWRDGAVTSPRPFTEMPVTWERAFGGAGFPTNPLGRGHAPVGEVDMPGSHMLPNVEDPRDLVRSPDDRPRPAGFGPIDFTWPQRFSKMGTYDEQWLKTRFPGMAADLDWTAFNAALEDQQIEGFFRGDERFTVEGMHAEHPTIEGELPGLVARVFVDHEVAPGDVRFVEVPTRLDTVHLFPSAMRGVLIYRGLHRVREDDAADVKRVLVASELIGEPRTPEHYRAVLERRLDRKTGHLASVRDSDLLHARPDTKLVRRPEEVNDVEELVRPVGTLQRNMAERRRLERDKARAKLVELGLNPDDFQQATEEVPEVPDHVALEDFEELIPKLMAEAEAMQKRGEAEAKDAQERAREAYRAQGLDWDELRAKGEREMAGPPKFRAATELERIRAATRAANGGAPVPEVEAMLDDPKFVTLFNQKQLAMMAAYRRAALHQPVVDPMAPPQRDYIRELVAGALARAEALTEVDVTGADLSRMDLRGADFTGSFLESVDFTGSDLTDARFDRAVLVRANFTETTLDGCSFAESNLGGAVFTGAKARGARFLDADLERADLAGVALHACNLTRVNLRDAKLDGADFTGCNLRNLTVFDGDVPNVRFCQADLGEATFVNTSLEGSDFTGAQMEECTMMNVRAKGCSFREVRGRNLRVVMGASFEGASFVDAKLDASSLRGAIFRGADLSRASLDDADLSDADLTGATLYRVSAKNSRWVRADLTDAVLLSANLMNAILQKATLDRVDLRHANLFAADISRAKGGAQAFDGALLTRVQTLPRRPA
jgi:uncharacterized protein YjbI with pentapeptide repeats